MTRILLTVLFASCAALPVAAQTTPAVPAVPTLDLSVDAQRSAPNDLTEATLFVEASDDNLANLARRVNSATAAALATAKSNPAVKVRSAGTQTTPNYARNSNKIESWRMRAQLVLESRDTAAISDLIGKLQATGVGLEQLGFAPSPEARRKAEDEAIGEAIAAFKARATLASAALDRHYRIRQIALNTQASIRPPVPMMKMSLARTAEAAPAAPAEAGESQITVTVTGSVELIP